MSSRCYRLGVLPVKQTLPYADVVFIVLVLSQLSSSVSWMAKFSGLAAIH